MRQILYRSLERDWSTYRNDSRGHQGLGWLPFFWRVVRRYLFRKQWVEVWCQRSAIEMYVTSKHVRAWEEFVETGADYLVVLEDDVFFGPDAAARFNESVLPALVESPERLVYIDLAGGLAPLELRIGPLEAGRKGDAIYYSKPVTNTACAYLINRDLARYFVAAIVDTPHLRMIGIDWLMNKMFMSMAGGCPTAVCVHFRPTIFQHGSFTGQYVSWQK